MNKAQTVKPELATGFANLPADKPRRLGRGLSSMLGAPVKIDLDAALPPPRLADAAKPWHHHPATELAQGLLMLPIDALVANRFQPRRTFEEAGLSELAASIRSAGVVQPVLVRRRKGADTTRSAEATDIGGSTDATYELVAGERRWRAARLAGLTTIPAVVAELADEQAAEWALIENVQRADLSSMEQAYAIRQLCEKFGLTHQQAADKLGLDRTSVTNLIRLTDLEPEVRAMMEANSLTAGHGKALLAMNAGSRRIKLAERASASGWSVRRLAGAVAMMIKGDGESGTAADAIRAAALLGGDMSKGGMARESLAHAGMRELEKQLGDHLGTKVYIKVKVGGKKGALTVQFFDLDHFDGLMGKMGFVMK